MQNILNLYSNRGIVVLMGDMNVNLLESAEHQKISGRKSYFLNFLHENNLVSLNTLEDCKGAKSSFVSYDNSCESLIDHILLPCDKLYYVCDCEIIDNDCLNVSRHRPIFCGIRAPEYQQHPYYSNDLGINWKKVTCDLANEFKTCLNSNEVLQNIEHCDINTKVDIDNVLSNMTNEVKSTALQCFPEKQFKHFLKPYWSDQLNTLHKDMRQKRADWLICGRPRGIESSAYNIYKNAKRLFRKKHRHAIDEYFRKKVDEIDKCAEVDSSLFWRLVNGRRKQSASAPGAEMNFNGKLASSPQEITDEWANYFKELYTPTVSTKFDEEHKRDISNRLHCINDSLAISESPVISAEEVQSAVRLGKKGKAAGEDGISYEHMQYGGEILFRILAKLFTAMIKLSYAPINMKKGIIITLFKGGNKRKDDPENYRAITLSSV
ncbi:MAG: hypothetical protein N0C90_15945, partial [Candidatus Thiodiazotropha endolucinida]|nr:hypothetical protein [Candidatus Thiodiazotropha taylori]MCW4262850.1 hypothetical protein [Candidatus Thiodiazotropha endolucinida]